jgi:hypothetical protein
VSPSEDEGAEALDLAQRQLCPDGACVGLVAENGRCRLCGRSATEAPGDAHGATGDAHGATGDAHGATGDTVDEAVDPDLAARRLCPDGACVGLVGGDGRCKVCGAEDAPTVGGHA